MEMEFKMEWMIKIDCLNKSGPLLQWGGIKTILHFPKVMKVTSLTLDGHWYIYIYQIRIPVLGDGGKMTFLGTSFPGTISEFSRSHLGSLFSHNLTVLNRSPSSIPTSIRYHCSPGCYICPLWPFSKQTDSEDMYVFIHS